MKTPTDMDMVHAAYRLLGAAQGTKESRAFLAGARWMQTEEPTTGKWIAADDYHRNVKALDVALNGEGGATRPLLIDVLAQVEAEVRRSGKPLLAPTTTTEGGV